MTESQHNRGTVRWWIFGTLAGVVLLAGTTAYVALQTEGSIRRSFENNLTSAVAQYARCQEALGHPPATQDEFLGWLDHANPPEPAVRDMVAKGRVQMAWGEKLLPQGGGSELLFATTTDPPVRGERPVVLLDGTLRWLTHEEFDAAPRAAGLK